MKKKRTVTVRIETERCGFSFPFMPTFGGGGDLETDEPDSAPEEETDFPEQALTVDLFEAFAEEKETSDGEEKPERSEFFAEGRLVTTDDRVEIVYEESVLTGMEGSVTSIGFSRADPSVVTMLREGFVNTAFVFEQGKRHICVYNTPFSSFEICVAARKVSNTLLENGIIELDYLTEIHGARTERCKMRIVVE